MANVEGQRNAAASMLGRLRDQIDESAQRYDEWEAAHVRQRREVAGEMEARAGCCTPPFLPPTNLNPNPRCLIQCCLPLLGEGNHKWLRPVTGCFHRYALHSSNTDRSIKSSTV